MAGDHRPLSAQERLAISRQALVNQLQGGDRRRSPEKARAFAGESLNERHGQRGSSFLDRLPWLSMAKNVGERWWRRHPANAVGQLAIPLLERYAQNKPFKLVAAAGAVGAVAVLVKPWRLLSVTAVLAAVLKTSDVASVVNSLVQNSRKH